MSKTFLFVSKHMYSRRAVTLGAYRDGSIAIMLVADDGDSFKPTVNLQDHGERPAPDCVFVKAYGAAEGMYETLHANGIVGDIVRVVSYGPYDAKAYECKLTIPREDCELL